LGGVLDAVVAVPELSRRFIVGRSGSSLVDVLAVPDDWGVDVLWSLPVAGAVSPLVFVTR